MAFDSNADLSGAVARLFIYPVKSCAGIEVQEALLTDAGLEFDRAWMVVDEQGAFLTQRALPRMALIRPPAWVNCACLWQLMQPSRSPRWWSGKTPYRPGTWVTKRPTG